MDGRWCEEVQNSWYVWWLLHKSLSRLFPFPRIGLLFPGSDGTRSLHKHTNYIYVYKLALVCLHILYHQNHDFILGLYSYKVNPKSRNKGTTFPKISAKCLIRTLFFIITDSMIYCQKREINQWLKLTAMLFKVPRSCNWWSSSNGWNLKCIRLLQGLRCCVEI